MTVREKINSGFYNVQKYGYVPLGSDMDWHNASKEERRVDSANYRTAENAANAQFRKDLEEQFGIAGNPKADKLFSLAWEMGHSSGYSEICSYYEDMVELVK